jgi:tetratricopeptide (TPR) repeat protein
MAAPHRAAFVLCVCLLALPFAGAQQVKPPAATEPPRVDIPIPLELPTDDRVKRMLEAAADYVQTEDWAQATAVLQKLLERKEDVFVPVERKGADGKPVTTLVSGRSEAGRMIASLPPAGREFYQLKYGPFAAELLKQARADGKQDLLVRIVREYLHTEAGPDALLDLGQAKEESGEHSTAALYFLRALDHRGIARWTPPALYLATRALRKIGDGKHADLTEKQLRERVGAAGLTVGKRKITLEELDKELKELAKPADPSETDWPVFGGNAARSAQGSGGVPLLEARWTQPTVRTPELQETLKQAFAAAEERRQPVLPAFFPITVRTERGGRTRELVCFRSHWGVHAADVKTGKLVWETVSSWSADRMLKDNRKVEAFKEWAAAYKPMYPAVLWENSSLGSLSSDGTLLYLVEDLCIPGVPPGALLGAGERNPPLGKDALALDPDAPPGTVLNQAPNRGGPEVQQALAASRLQAYELSTGKLKWEVGSRDDKGELSDSVFLGPPLPLGGKLHVLTEKSQELRLACLEPATGKVAFVQALGGVTPKIHQAPLRRIQAAHLAAADGILVCPTNAGAVFGLDLLSGNVVWASGYREDNAAAPGPPPLGGANLTPPLWKATAPVIADGKVVFAAPDARSLCCLNLRDGAMVWREKRQEDDLYLAGVFAGRVVVVGKKSCRALKLATGATEWALEVGLPAGQGVASDNVYYLPLREAAASREPEVCAIDVAKGVIVAHAKSRKKEVPGNLLFTDGVVLSQTVDSLRCYPQLREKLREIDEVLRKNSPNDPTGLGQRGELKLDRGDLPGAIDDFKKALDNKPPREAAPALRARLYEALTELFQRDFDKAEKYLKDFEDLSRVEIDPDLPEARKAELKAEEKRRLAVFHMLVGRGRESQGKLVEALNAYLAVSSLGPSDELLRVPDEPAVKVQRDVWVRGRIEQLLKKATPEQRKQLEDEVAKKWKQIQGRKDAERTSWRV